jgi:hypothetical protein
MEKTIKTMEKNSGKICMDHPYDLSFDDKNYEPQISTRIPRNPEKTMEKLGLKYRCDLCDFNTNLKGNYTHHLSSKKHITRVNTSNTPSTAKSQTNLFTHDIVTDASSNINIDKEL